MHRDAGAWNFYSRLRLQHTSPGGRRSVAPAEGQATEGQAAEAAASGAAPEDLEVMCVGLSAENRTGSTQLLASGAQDGTVCLWSVATGARLDTLHAHPGHKNWVMAI